MKGLFNRRLLIKIKFSYLVVESSFLVMVIPQTLKNAIEMTTKKKAKPSMGELPI